MAVKLAIIGLRHGHIMALLAEAEKLGVEVVAVCEEDAATRAAFQNHDKVRITHDSYQKMLAEVPCDIIGVGDYYGIRGQRVLDALAAGRHVVVDKPLCTSILECDQITELAAQRGLCVSCMFGLRTSAQLITMKKLIAQGLLGEIRTICITGQHPLNLGVRPGWYFEPGKHGGTINDIGIHAVDLIPWLCGQQITTVVAARTWNAKASRTPWFNDCAQVLLKLGNQAGVMADFSYLSPDKCGFTVRQYWRVTVHGDDGLLETQKGEEELYFASSKAEQPEKISCTLEAMPEDFLTQIIREKDGQAIPGQLTTGYVLKTSRKALQIQYAADNALRDFDLQ
jgi:predicted dehydrogenase